MPNRIEVVQLPTENTTDPFKSLFETISKAIAKHNWYACVHKSEHLSYRSDSNAESKEPRNVLRILLQSFGSPMWNSSAELAQQLQFLHALRGLLRNSFAVCYVTFPSHLFAAQHVRRVLHLCDSAVRLQSFQGTRYALTAGATYAHQTQPHIRQRSASTTALCTSRGCRA